MPKWPLKVVPLRVKGIMTPTLYMAPWTHHNPHWNSIGSAVYTRLTVGTTDGTNRQTHGHSGTVRPRYDSGNNRPHLMLRAAIQPKNFAGLHSFVCRPIGICVMPSKIVAEAAMTGDCAVIGRDMITRAWKRNDLGETVRSVRNRRTTCPLRTHVNTEHVADCRATAAQGIALRFN